MIHRALLGSLERFFGILIEHYKGNFPLWLSPVQVIIIPIADRHSEYASKLNQRLREEGIRTRVDERREKMGYKIRDAEKQKIPLILIIGDKEVEHGDISLRIHTAGDRGRMEIDEFLAKIKELIKNKSLEIEF
jgi:threonyl-tRNA synthetase